MKKNKNNKGFAKKKANTQRQGRKFSLRKNFWIYLGLTVAALVFTQALMSSISAVIFIFLCCLPPLSLLYVLCSLASIKLKLNSTVTETEKFRPVEFSLTLYNESVLPFPFVEADITVPGDDAVRCEKLKTRLSLIPFGKYNISKKLSFFYRGSYEIGAAEIYCYDLFRFFRIRIDINLMTRIFVFPRKLVYSEYFRIDESDDASDSTVRLSGNNNTEINDIRTYQMGDTMRLVHWKLSSKSEELMVKQYAMNSHQSTVIICDTPIRYDASQTDKYKGDVNEAAADAVIEAAIAVVNNCLQNDSVCTLAWFDSRSETGYYSAKVATKDDIENTYELFATAPVDMPRVSLSTVVDSACGAENANLIIITGCIDEAFDANINTVKQNLALHGVSRVECLAFIPYNKVKAEYSQEFSENVRNCKMSLEKSSVSVKEPQLMMANSNK